MRPLSRRSVITYGLATAAALAVPRRLLAQAAATDSAEQRLKERGIELPKLSAPVASYAPYVRSGDQVYLSGVPPRRPDGTLATGKVGRDVTVEEAYQHARLAGLALLATMREAAGGSLDNVARVVKVTGMVNAVPEFADHPKVINGCSDLFVEVFGDKGRSARSAVGMASLPFNITVEIEAIVEVA